MGSGFLKRHASKSPDREREVKKVGNMSPEEGELCDSTPIGKTPLPPPPHSLPPKPTVPHYHAPHHPRHREYHVERHPPPKSISSHYHHRYRDYSDRSKPNASHYHGPHHLRYRECQGDRPPAPKGGHSPTPLQLPPAPRKTGTPQLEADSRDLRLEAMRKSQPVRRSVEEEKKFYGRVFVGCGNQQDYSVTTKLGEGTFGEVHKAIQKDTGVSVALKRILMHNEKEGMPVTALREIKVLKALKHPCIVQILDMFVVRSTANDPLSVYMVFPYMDHDLAGLLENDRVKLQPSQIKLYMKQLLEGTEYMHRNHILHRDMKAANLLISNSGSLQIADFGLARSFDERGNCDSRFKERKYTNCVVTRWYRPPELLLGARQYGGEIDMWGIGCVLGEMFWRRPILPGNSDLDQLDKIWQLCGTPNQHTWPNFDALPGCEGIKRFNSYSRKLKQTWESIGLETCDLMDKLLICNPRERITAVEALDHDYFWTDPLPADPKTLPSYEASHEFDKRGHRNNLPHPNAPPPNLNRSTQESLNGPRNRVPRGPSHSGVVPPPIGIHGSHLPPPRGQRPPFQQYQQHQAVQRGSYLTASSAHTGREWNSRQPHLPLRPDARHGFPPAPRGTFPADRRRDDQPRHDGEGGPGELNYG